MNEKTLTSPVLEVRDLKKYYTVPKTSSTFGKKTEVAKAVDGVSFEINRNETFGLVGESGCGKSTTGKSVLRLIEPTAGEILYRGNDLCALDTKSLRKTRRRLQMVFQDPYSSLNPKQRAGNILREPLDIHNIGTPSSRDDKVFEILESVGLGEEHFYRFPHEFSGGQKQRIGIARALIADPEVVICDEAVSALDVTVQAQILELLNKLQKERSLSYLFISHDMSVIRHISDRVGVMYKGKIVEEGPTAQIFEAPSHPYTKALLSAVPRPNPRHRNERSIYQGE